MAFHQFRSFPEIFWVEELHDSQRRRIIIAQTTIHDTLTYYIIALFRACNVDSAVPHHRAKEIVTRLLDETAT